MLTGVRFQANPTDQQRLTLSQWMGCSRAVWNGKCDEHEYLSTYARKYLPKGTYAPLDQSFAQFKDRELSPWLYGCPSQILRNSAVAWYRSYQAFFKKQGGRPRRKKKGDRGSVHLTKELFRFEECADGGTRLFIGTKTNNIGYLSFKAHRSFGIPNSIRILKEAGRYYVSFSYEDGKAKAETEIPELSSPERKLEWLRSQEPGWLQAHVCGHDRGVAVPVHSGDVAYDFTEGQKRSKARDGKKIKRLQRQLARQKKGSNRRAKTKHKLARVHLSIRNVRKDFCHKTSRSIVDAPALVNVFEHLRLKDMTKRPKPQQGEDGRHLPNGAAAKAGLNRSMLEPGLGMVVDFVRYKSERAGKLLLLVDPKHTSQECASCGHVHPDNRRTQAKFECQNCGHRDNADRNAAFVIGKRAVSQIMDAGTALSERGLLSKPRPDTGRGADGKTDGAFVPDARGDETSKEKRPGGIPFREAA